MIRSAASKVAWVGRTASMVFGLALVLALLFGLATTAFGANGGTFVLGSLNNTATAITKLTGTVGGGPALRVSNPSTATGSTALDLQVATGKAPMKVNSGTKVANLNADKLDGTDSKTFGTYMATSQSITGNCTTAGIWEGCAGYRVTVPAGKVYDVTVWSSVNAKSAGSAGTLFYCPAVEGGSFGLSCITRPGKVRYSHAPEWCCGVGGEFWRDISPGRRLLHQHRHQAERESFQRLFGEHAHHADGPGQFGSSATHRVIRGLSKEVGPRLLPVQTLLPVTIHPSAWQPSPSCRKHATVSPPRSWCTLVSAIGSIPFRSGPRCQVAKLSTGAFFLP